MSARRLKGYVVRTSEGWYVSSAGTLRSITPNKKLRTVFPNASRAALHVAHDGDVSLPVFATRKPKPAPVVASIARFDGAERMATCTAEPAPVVAAEGRYALLGGQPDYFEGWGDVLRQQFVGTRDQVRLAHKHRRDLAVVRILPDGAHEAACEAARREGAEAARIDALLGLRDACEFKADTVSDEAAIGLRMAMLFVDKALTKTAEEAAKGQAK